MNKSYNIKENNKQYLIYKLVNNNIDSLV